MRQNNEKLGPKSLVKIRSVTAKSLLIMTNVTLRVVICKDGRRNLHLKFGLNRVSNSWDIPDMDKCQQYILCCLDKWHLDSWHFIKMVPGTYLSKFCLNRVINSWDIPDMDKCLQEKMSPGQMSLLTVENCSRGSQEPTFQVYSKLGQ